MGPMPDLSGLVYFAVFGMICAALVVAGVAGWVGIHLAGALLAYMGLAS